MHHFSGKVRGRRAKGAKAKATGLRDGSDPVGLAVAQHQCQIIGMGVVGAGIHPDRLGLGWVDLARIDHPGQHHGKAPAFEMHLIDADHEQRAGPGDGQKRPQRFGTKMAMGEGAGRNDRAVAGGKSAQRARQIDLVKGAVQTLGAGEVQPMSAIGRSASPDRPEV
jgi:hypothetical protein